jgi:hypothetical protein
MFIVTDPQRRNSKLRRSGITLDAELCRSYGAWVRSGSVSINMALLRSLMARCYIRSRISRRSTASRAQASASSSK